MRRRSTKPPPSERRRALAAPLAGIGAGLGAGLVAGVALASHRRARSQETTKTAPPKSPADVASAQPGRGRLAQAPRHIPARGWGDIAWRTLRETGDDRLAAVAAGVTFYVLLSVFPALGVFVSLYGLFADVATVQGQLADIAAFLPPDVVSILGDQMLILAQRPPASLGLAFLASLLLSLWSAKAGVTALMDGLNVAYDEDEKRSFAKRTLMAYGATVVGLLAMTAMAGLLVAVPLILQDRDLRMFAPAWTVFSRLAALALTFAVLLVIYRYGASRTPPKWRWVAWGAALASLVWIGGSIGFSWYVANIAHYDATYGSLGTVVIFMMWIWVSAMVVLVGAELNSEIEHQTVLDSTVGRPKPFGRRGAVMADTVGRTLNVGGLVGRILSGGARG